MNIENNEQAYNTLKNAQGSLENKMRELYNLGYNAGRKAGRDEALDDILEHFKKSMEDRND